jgi:hypothetical protein
MPEPDKERKKDIAINASNKTKIRFVLRFNTPTDDAIRQFTK